MHGGCGLIDVVEARKKVHCVTRRTTTKAVKRLRRAHYKK
jgi:hypothetical protein